MTKRTIVFFIKIFEKEEYADQFLAGHLYLNPLSYFKNVEKSLDNERFDKTEGIAVHWQPKGIVMNLRVPGIGETQITDKDLAGPITMQPDSNVNILCLYSVSVTDAEIINGNIECSEDKIEEIIKEIKVDERCITMGNYAVLTYAVPFIVQVRKALASQDIKFADHLVEYYDEQSFHGQFSKNQIPFKKQKRFSHQKEYRICVYPSVIHNRPITLSVGSIDSFSGKIESSRLNDVLVLTKVRP